MIRRYRFGHPICTEAVVMQVPESAAEEFSLLQLEADGEHVILSGKMEESDVVYGLGEQVRGINKRGFSYTS